MLNKKKQVQDLRAAHVRATETENSAAAAEVGHGLFLDVVKLRLDVVQHFRCKTNTLTSAHFDLFQHVQGQ